MKASKGVRICTVCGTRNPGDRYVCSKCTSDIHHISPSSEIEEAIRVGEDPACRIKICPHCGHENSAEDVVCSMCTEAIDLLKVPAGKVSKPNSAKDEKAEINTPAPILHGVQTRLETLLLRCHDGTLLKFKNGEILGRDGDIGGDYLNKFDTISRSHARFTLNDGVWHITDLNSSNGTFLNGTRLTPSQDYPLRAYDQIRFSSKLNVTVGS